MRKARESILAGTYPVSAANAPTTTLFWVFPVSLALVTQKERCVLMLVLLPINHCPGRAIYPFSQEFVHDFVGNLHPKGDCPLWAVNALVSPRARCYSRLMHDRARSRR